MLRITLYKNCILNETYQNVISTGLKNGVSILDNYLNNLTKLILSDIDYVYQETKGTLYFDYTINNGDIYDYNYMKVQCFSDEDTPTLLFTRYCFIQDIRLDNECVYLDYEEDIWSSYSSKINGTTNSFIRNTRVLTFSNKTFTYRKLPINYEGNNKLSWTSKTTVNNIRAVIQVQHYNLSQQGIRTGRTTDYYAIDLSANTLDAFITNLTWIIKLQTEKIFYERYNYGTDNDNNETYNEDKYYFEIGRIYLVPKSFVPDSRILSNPYSRYFIDLTSVTGNLIELKTIIPSYEYQSELFTITHNFKDLYIGTLTNQIELVNNGTSHSVGLLFSKQQDGVSFKINVENIILDLTYDFEYEATITSISGMEAYQLRMSRDIAKSQATSNFVGNTLSSTGDLMGDVSSFGYSARFASSKKNQKKMGQSGGNILGDAGNFITGIWDYVDEMKMLNANMYQTTSGVFNNCANFVNSYYGICLFTKVSDNDIFVKKSINEIGYEVYDYISDLSDIDLNNPSYFETLGINYNSLKFDMINLNGSFPRRIAKILNSILENGVKIWYTSTLIDDNLVVG